MAKLTICRGGYERTVFFDGTPLLDDILTREGFLTPHPCGGKGKCGKCAVIAEGALSAPTETERAHSLRLSCMTRLLGDARVTLSDEVSTMHIESDDATLSPAAHAVGYGAAADIGTTTLAVKVYDLQSGECVGSASTPNPQASVAADVIGRIEAAMNGKAEFLRALITDTLRDLLGRATPTGIRPTALTVTGNTTMLYLLCGYDTTPLSRAPFVADHLFGGELALPWSDIPVYLPPCMNAFVGADITCAVLAAGMCERDEISLLCDIGTNGELALWKNGTLYVTSTAAGPAFEGAGIVCGCGSIDGAIDRVWVEDGALRIHTLGDQSPVGLCGSGVIDAVAAGLETEAIDESGAMDEPLILGGDIALHPKDVRAVQLAKAAVAAGIDTLFELSHTTPREIQTMYIAGGFGTHLSLESAAAIGLLPGELCDRAIILGNAALRGAALSLTDPAARKKLGTIATRATHVNLGGDSRFSAHYIDRMIFGEDI